jgi:hypothetical protein
MRSGRVTAAKCDRWQTACRLTRQLACAPASRATWVPMLRLICSRQVWPMLLLGALLDIGTNTRSS